jgi:hypothetical protein
MWASTAVLKFKPASSLLWSAAPAAACDATGALLSSPRTMLLNQSNIPMVYPPLLVGRCENRQALFFAANGETIVQEKNGARHLKITCRKQWR